MTWDASNGLSKFRSAAVRSLVTALRSQFTNWFSLAVLSWVALPSRFPPRHGWPRLAQLSVEVRLRNQLRARCRLEEVAGFLDVWVYREYDAPGIRWDQLRTVVDVGANVGAATLWFASRAPHARIVAVEPSPGVLRSLARNVEANGLGHRVHVMPVALGAATGIGYLRPSPSSGTASVSADQNAGDVSVPLMSLAELLNTTDIRELDLLKLDCEGAEFEILRSSEMSVLNSISAIVGEFHATAANRRQELEQILVRSGFTCRFHGGEDLGLFLAIRNPSRTEAV